MIVITTSNSTNVNARRRILRILAKGSTRLLFTNCRPEKRGERVPFPDPIERFSRTTAKTHGIKQANRAGAADRSQ